MAEFLCGYTPKRRVTRDELSKGDRKVVENFAEFLRGKGSRCPTCLHKATKHWVTCGAKSCDCRLSSSDVLAVRAQVKARGWEQDDG